MKRLAVSAAASLPFACLLSAWTDLPAWQYVVLGAALVLWLLVEGRLDRRDRQAERVVLKASMRAHMAALDERDEALEERDEARALLRRAHIRLADRGMVWTDLRVNGGRPL